MCVGVSSADNDNNVIAVDEPALLALAGRRTVGRETAPWYAELHEDDDDDADGADVGGLERKERLAEAARKELRRKRELGADGAFERTRTPYSFDGAYFGAVLEHSMPGREKHAAARPQALNAIAERARARAEVRAVFWFGFLMPDPVLVVTPPGGAVCSHF